MERALRWIIYLGLSVIAFVPLMTNGNFFFPYIFTKALVFRVIVEVMLLLYLLLVFLNKNYRPRVTVITIAFFVYLFVTIISSLFGDNFYLSFWGDIERSEGILLLVHLFALFLVVSGVLKRKEDWFLLFDVFIIASLFTGIIALREGGLRLAGTIGNSAFVAGYFIFSVFFSSFLFFQRKFKFFKIYYILAAIFGLYIIFGAGTRGAFIALGLSLVSIFTFSVFFVKFNKKIKASFLVFVILLAGVGGVIYASKNAGWAKNSPVLGRVTSISITERTAQTRLMTWDSAWQGIKEKPVLGWGYENFYLVFNKHFNPEIYEDAGSPVWFDRAHNVFLDKWVMGGTIGFIAYLFLLFYPVYFLIKKLLKRERIITSIVFISLIVAYSIQNLFVFDALVTYIPFIFVLGFISFYAKDFEFKFLEKTGLYKIILIISVVLFIPVLYMVNVKPAKANLETVRAIRLSANQDYKNANESFLKALSYNTYGNQEYRLKFLEFADSAFLKLKINNPLLEEIANKAQEEAIIQIEENSMDATNYIAVMRHYNRAYSYNINLLHKVIDISSLALELSPARPHTYYELGYAQIYLGRHYFDKEEKEKAEEYYNQAMESFEKSIELNDDVVESYLNVVLMSFVAQREDVVAEYVSKMDELSLPYRKEHHLKQLAKAAFSTKYYDWSIKFYKDLIGIKPGNPQYLADLAHVYFYADQKEKAIETAGKIMNFDSKYEKYAGELIDRFSEEP